MKKHKKTWEWQTKNPVCSLRYTSKTAKFTKWTLVFGVITCAAVAGFVAVKSTSASNKIQEKESPAVLTEAPEASIESSRNAQEQEFAVLEKEEMELVQELMRTFPNSEQPIVLMGDVYRRHGNSVEALKFWERAVQINPKRFDVFYNMGLVAFEKEEHVKAITLWRKTLEINPKIPDVHSWMGQALLALGKHTEAIEELEKEIEISPQSTISYYLLGQVNFSLKEYEKAKKYYEKVIELDPDHSNAYYGLSTVCMRLKQQEKAREYMAVFKKLKARYIELVKNRNRNIKDTVVIPETLAELAMDAEKLYRARGDLQRAEELLKRAETLDPDNTKCLERLATLYQMSNRIPDALEQFEKIREIQPRNPLCYFNIGILSIQLKRFDDAEKAFQKAITLAPDQSFGYRELARLYLWMNSRLAEARKLAEKAVALEESATNYFILSWACDMNGDTASALVAIEQAIKLQPDNPKYKQIHERLKKKN